MVCLWLVSYCTQGTMQWISLSFYVITDKSHKIPHGDWFDMVSCPHYLAEIIIYFGILVVLGFDHTFWWAVFGFTLSNQTVAAKFVHRWYLDNFPSYPKQRKAVIPKLL